MCEALTYLSDNSFIRFDTKLYRQILGIPMDTNCATLKADLFLFCYEMSLSYKKKLKLFKHGRLYLST